MVRHEIVISRTHVLIQDYYLVFWTTYLDALILASYKLSSGHHYGSKNRVVYLGNFIPQDSCLFIPELGLLVLCGVFIRIITMKGFRLSGRKQRIYYISRIWLLHKRERCEVWSRTLVRISAVGGLMTAILETSKSSTKLFPRK